MGDLLISSSRPATTKHQPLTAYKRREIADQIFDGVSNVLDYQSFFFIILLEGEAWQSCA
jgi:hypothetical protein